MLRNINVIRYLAANNPARLAELLEDIWCCAWNHGSRYQVTNTDPFEADEVDDFYKWLYQEVTDEDFFRSDEVSKWKRRIKCDE